MLPIADAARASFPALDLDDTQAADVRVGRRLDVRLDATTALFAPDGEFLALYQEGEGGGAKAVAVFC
jgi:tRNA pseudouridine55 synthase